MTKCHMSHVTYAMHHETNASELQENLEEILLVTDSGKWMMDNNWNIYLFIKVT